MDDVVGVCFKPTGKVYYFWARGLSPRIGESVIVETSRGQELADVVCTGPRGDHAKGKLKPILRRATARDIARGQDNRHRAEEARRVCQRLLKQMELAVKLVDVEYAFAGSHITFAFASEDRTDFGELHRRLKEIYDCEIELRQIGVRDQAKILGGLGPCGRQLCCSTFLRQFQPVTIRMAKDQDIALNPTKISGQCGRLMCCLRYEHGAYKEARDKLPDVGAQVQTDLGQGEVAAIDYLEERVTVSTADGEVTVGREELTEAEPAGTPTESAQASDEGARAPVAGPAQAASVGEEGKGSHRASSRSRRSRSRRSGPREEARAPRAAPGPGPASEPSEPGGESGQAAPSKRRRRRRRPRRSQQSDKSG